MIHDPYDTQGGRPARLMLAGDVCHYMAVSRTTLDRLISLGLMTPGITRPGVRGLVWPEPEITALSLAIIQGRNTETLVADLMLHRRPPPDGATD